MCDLKTKVAEYLAAVLADETGEGKFDDHLLRLYKIFSIDAVDAEKNIQAKALPFSDDQLFSMIIDEVLAEEKLRE